MVHTDNRWIAAKYPNLFKYPRICVPKKLNVKLSYPEPLTDEPLKTTKRTWDHRLKRTDIFMTSHDVQLIELIKTGNTLREAPTPVQSTKSGIYRRALKRALDVTLVLLSLPVIVPVIAALALMVSLRDGKPFYRQERVGQNGRIFSMWKLRSMIPNADDALETYLSKNPAMRTEWDTKQKLLDDPRVTRLGHFLRRSSIDELPQLYNVLRGDMSLVGPRPMMVDQQKLYDGQDYFELRPGITGLWQISDRNKTSFADRAFYDAKYNQNMSLKTDIAILMSTVRVVLRGTGC